MVERHVNRRYSLAVVIQVSILHPVDDNPVDAVGEQGSYGSPQDSAIREAWQVAHVNKQRLGFEASRRHGSPQYRNRPSSSTASTICIMSRAVKAVPTSPPILLVAFWQLSAKFVPSAHSRPYATSEALPNSGLPRRDAVRSAWDG